MNGLLKLSSQIASIHLSVNPLLLPQLKPNEYFFVIMKLPVIPIL